MIASKIDLLKNISQFEYQNDFFDLHNDYDFTGFTLDSNKVLTFNFKHFQGTRVVGLSFQNVILTKISFLNSEVNEDDRTIDNIYRGRYEMDGALIELDSSGRGYFYLELYSGKSFEFWTDELIYVNSEK